MVLHHPRAPVLIPLQYCLLLDNHALKMRIMPGYYAETLAAERLRRCYELAPPRVQRYLTAELQFVLDHLSSTDLVLDLGCGYGRTLGSLQARARAVVGIDSSHASLRLACASSPPASGAGLLAMDAAALGFAANLFDTAVCIQNGISAFHVDRRQLVAEAVRVTRPGGRVLFSSYAPGFWPDRLTWFRLQADAGLLGEIDEEATGDGVIVCRDGFRATTVGPAEFAELADSAGVSSRIVEVDGSSLFCEMQVD